MRNLIAALIVLVTVISVNELSKFPLGNTYTNWIIFGATIFLFLNSKKYYYDPINKINMGTVKIYIAWICCCIIRGFFVADYYWDYKSLIGSGLALLLVVSIFVFTNPRVIYTVFSVWMKYALPLFLIFMFLISSDAYGFFLIPISFLALFFPILNKKWKIIVLIISLLVIFVDFDARSNVIKFVLPLLFSCILFFRKFLNSRFYKLMFKFLFVLPFIFLTLAISNVFNVFQIDEYIGGTYTERKIIDGEVVELNLKADTRTVLYREVIVSSILNNYILFGRTPARGNDSKIYGIHAAEELKTGRYERHTNEVSILNIFTWTGLIGVLLYLLVFYKATSLAITRSNNRFLKILGLYVAFRWMYAWVEDPNTFSIMNIMLWIIIAMCYSEQFRKMTDLDFKNWLMSVLTQKSYKISYKANRDLHRHSRI